MEEAIAKAAALVEAHHYIRRFEGRIVVVKVGGSIMDEPATMAGMIQANRWRRAGRERGTTHRRSD